MPVFGLLRIALTEFIFDDPVSLRQSETDYKVLQGSTRFYQSSSSELIFA